MKHIVAAIAAVFALLSLPASLLASGQIRADQRHDACITSQKQWKALHDVIEAAVSPDPAGSALDHLTIPADTPASVIEILRQLTVAERIPNSADRLLVKLGPRPSC